MFGRVKSKNLNEIGEEMAIRIKPERNHFLTEVVVEIPASLKDVDDLLKATRTTAQMNVLYNQGGVIGIRFEQKTSMTESQAEKVREILGLGEKII